MIKKEVYVAPNLSGLTSCDCAGPIIAARGALIRCEAASDGLSASSQASSSPRTMAARLFCRVQTHPGPVFLCHLQRLYPRCRRESRCRVSKWGLTTGSRLRSPNAPTGSSVKGPPLPAASPRQLLPSAGLSRSLHSLTSSSFGSSSLVFSLSLHSRVSREVKTFLPPDTPFYLFQSTSLSKQVVKQSEWENERSSKGLPGLLPSHFPSRTALSAAESSAEADQPHVMICWGRVLHSWPMRVCEPARQKYRSATATWFIYLRNGGKPSPPPAAYAPIELRPWRDVKGPIRHLPHETLHTVAGSSFICGLPVLMLTHLLQKWTLDGDKSPDLRLLMCF